MNAGATSEHIQLGHAARRAGRPGDALDHYRAALASEPDNPEANSVYGLMLLHLGRAEEAEPPLRKAVEISPSHAAFRMNLAQLLAHQGKLGEAQDIVAGVAAAEPRSWWAWDRLGDLQVRLRRFADAETHFRRAAELRPDDPSLLFKWARSSFDCGRIDEAVRILKHAATLAPSNEAIFRLQSEICELRSQWPALAQVAGSWAQAHPGTAQAWRLLARAQWETGYLRQAMQSFRNSLGLGWRDAHSLASFGKLCLSALEFEAATAAFAEAEALDPDSRQMLSGKSLQLMFAGRYEEAQSYCRRALKANRSDAFVYKLLTQLTNGRLSEEEFNELQVLADREDVGIQDRIFAAFALADCLDTRGEIGRAFAAYERANRFARESSEKEGFTYDRVVRTRQTDELMSLFNSVPARTEGVSGPTPVFIVGMPRSGTTLIESVIGAHHQVFACGERLEMRWITQEFLDHGRRSPAVGIPEETWKQWRDSYWREIPDLRGATAITDKNPWNFDALGVITRVFPGARIIHVRRNPVDTGLSIYRNSFSKFQPFTNRLEDIGHYYGEYARLMAHWERVAGDRFTTVQYEDFIGRFDVAGPALLAACGLDWEESCRDYWKSTRVISTMSTMQARRPPGRGPGRAELCAVHLLPLVDALEAAGVDLRTGAWKRS